MRLLLDAHTLLWSQDDTGRLSPAAMAALTDPSHDRLLSVVTVWEIGIKVALKKLPLAKPFGEWIKTAISDMALSLLPISLEHVERQVGLLFHHRDPFDRLLVAQALVESVPLISCDTVIDAYGVQRIW